MLQQLPLVLVGSDASLRLEYLIDGLVGEHGGVRHSKRCFTPDGGSVCLQSEPHPVEALPRRQTFPLTVADAIRIGRELIDASLDRARRHEMFLLTKLAGERGLTRSMAMRFVRLAIAADRSLVHDDAEFIQAEIDAGIRNADGTVLPEFA